VRDIALSTADKDIPEVLRLVQAPFLQSPSGLDRPELRIDECPEVARTGVEASSIRIRAQIHR
jgi:hypothetical protein